MSDIAMKIAPPPVRIEPGLPETVPLGATTADWIALLKPRVMVLVVFTGIVGLCCWRRAGSIRCSASQSHLALRWPTRQPRSPMME